MRLFRKPLGSASVRIIANARENFAGREAAEVIIGLQDAGKAAAGRYLITPDERDRAGLFTKVKALWNETCERLGLHIDVNGRERSIFDLEQSAVIRHLRPPGHIAASYVLDACRLPPQDLIDLVAEANLIAGPREVQLEVAFAEDMCVVNEKHVEVSVGAPREAIQEDALFTDRAGDNPRSDAETLGELAEASRTTTAVEDDDDDDLGAYFVGMFTD